MSCTANNRIYVIHCALPRPCSSFLDEDWPATVTKPQRGGGGGRGRGGGGGEKMWFVHLDDVLQQSAGTVQLSRYTPTSAAAVCMCTSRREVNAERLWKGGGGDTHNKASSSIWKKKGNKNTNVTQQEKVEWRTSRRKGLLSCGPKIQKRGITSTINHNIFCGVKKWIESKITGNLFSITEQVVFRVSYK